MMIRWAHPVLKGSIVEIRRDDHVMIARVVWHDRGLAGLQMQERLPVEQIMSLSQAGELRLIPSEGATLERPKRSKFEDRDARSRGRAFEFVGVGFIGLCLSIGICTIVQQAFGRPIAELAATFGSSSGP
jgi:hypothetical protein